MISIHDLHDIAHQHGVTLAHHAGGPLAWYSPALRIISTQRGLTIWDYKSALAHELGHAAYGDHHVANSRFSEKQERRADRFAANLLIDRGQLEHLAPWHGHDFVSLAAELEVTPHLLQTYLNHQPINLKEATV